MLLQTSNNGIIVACDVSAEDHLIQLVDHTKDIPEISGYKIGKTLALRYGLKQIVETVGNHCDLPVIYDGQKEGNDVKFTISDFVQCYRDCNIDGLILFPFAGPENILGFIEHLRSENIVPIGGFELTQPVFYQSDRSTLDDLLKGLELHDQQIGRIRDRFQASSFGGYIADGARDRVMELYAASHVQHYIAPATKPPVIQKKRQVLETNDIQPTFLMPGIGRQKGTITAAFQAAGAGEGNQAYAIIGSSIYEARGPEGHASSIQEAARQFAAEVQSFNHS